MKTSLSYRITDDGENTFNKAVKAAKDWIELNINGPLRLRFIIQLKALPPDDEDVAEIEKTESLKMGKRSKKDDDGE